MISTAQDLMVFTEADFWRLPAEGLWEVVDGRAILLPPNDCEHQALSGALFLALSSALKKMGYGVVLATVNVSIPPPPDSQAAEDLSARQSAGAGD